MVSIESCGKTVREAIEDGLKKLNKSLGEVEVKILSQGGLLRKAKVLITVSGEGSESESLNIDYLGPKKQRSEEEILEREKRYQAYSENIKIPDDKEQVPQKPQKFQPQPQSAQNTQKPHFAQKPQRQEKTRENENKNDSNVRINNPPKKDAGDKFAKRDSAEKHAKDFKKDSNENFKRDNDKQRHERKEEYSVLTDGAVAKAQEFLSGVLNGMSISHTLEKNIDNNQLNLDIVCESGAAIGYRGETLSALEYLTCLCVSHGSERYKVAVDCNGYREKREQSLIALAERMAAKALKTGRKVVLEPMSSPSRKVIHSVLADNDKLITRSEGNEPNRRIVILPKRQKSSKPDKQNGGDMQEVQE